MVNNLMRVASSKSVIGAEVVAVECSASLDVLFHLRVKRLLFTVRHNYCPDFPATLDNTHYCGFVFAARSGNAALALSDVHVTGVAADESPSTSTSPSSFRNVPACIALRTR